MTEEHRKESDKFELMAVSIGMIVVIAIMLSLVYSDKVQKQQREADINRIESREIKSCILDSNKNFSIDGSFVLGTGGFSGGSYKDICYYFYMMGRNGFSIKSVPASCIEIVETNDEQPHIEGHFNEFGDVYTNMSSLTYDKEYIYEMTHYTMYVPVGYITQEYDIGIYNVVAK